MGKEVSTSRKKSVNKTSDQVNRLVKIAVLTAMSVILQAIEFKIPLFPPWLSFDLSDLPAMLGGLAFGPYAAAIVEVLKNALKFITVGTSTMAIGELANVIVGCALCVPAAIIYRRKRNIKSLWIGLLVGVVSFCIVGALMNIFVLMPLYMNLFGGDTILQQAMAVNPAWNSINAIVVLGVTPFNLLKGAVVSAATLLLHRPMKTLLLQEKDASRTVKSNKEVHHDQ